MSSQFTHTLFDNIFLETHAEVNLLQKDLENLDQLQVMYLSKNDEININEKHDEPDEPGEPDEPDESNESDEPKLHFDELIFTSDQVNKFYQIYQ